MIVATWLGRAGVALVLLACSSSDALAQSLADRYSRAQSLADACRFSDAIAEAESVLAQQAALGGPHLWQVEVSIADWLRLDGRLSNAESRARAALQAIEVNEPVGGVPVIRARNIYAAVLSEMGRSDEAAAMLSGARQAAGASAPKSLQLAELWQQTATLELNRNRPVAALAAVARSLELLEGGAGTKAFRRDLAILEAIANLDNRNPDEAEKAINNADLAASAVANDRSGARRSLLRARSAIWRSDLEGAVRWLADAEAEHQRSPDPCYRLFQSNLHRARGEVAFFRRAAVDADVEFRAALSHLDADAQGSPAEAGSLLFYLAVTAQFLGDMSLANQRYDLSANALRAAYGPASPALSVVLASRSIAASEALRGMEAKTWAEQALVAARDSPDRSAWSLAHVSAAVGFAAAANKERSLAEESFAEAFAGFESLAGSSSADLPPGLIALAELDLEAGDLKSATERLQRALGIQEQQGWSSSLGLARTRSLLAEVYFRQRHFNDAREQSQRATDIVARRLSKPSGPVSLGLLSEQRTAREIFERDLRIVEATRPSSAFSQADIERLARSMQYASASRTGAAVAQLTQRISASSDALGALLRERATLLEQGRAVEDRLIATAFDINRIVSPERKREARTELAQLEQRVNAIDSLLRKEHGLQQALFIPDPASIEAVQMSLKDNEALVSVTSAKQASYVLAITKAAVTFYEVELTSKEIEATVDRLRAVLDKDRWSPGAGFPTYDGDAAYKLYAALLGPAKDMLADASTLYVVADGALGAMPLGALLTERPNRAASFAAYREWKWLIREHAVVSMPSVASFVGLRGVRERRATSTKPFLGVGAVQHRGREAFLQSSSALPDLGTLWSGSLANPEELRRFIDLPNSEAELRELALLARADEDALWLRERASESRLKSMDLSDYRVIAFSTHGVLSGKLSGFAEPGLVLSPPVTATPEDDGFFTASEIAALKLNADWVLLSACSTAASDGSFDGEALSGLARAFFQAGARSLVVTYWPVDDGASRQFMRETLQRNLEGSLPSVAVSNAQLDIIDEGLPQFSHPMFWSGFAYVGVDPY